MPSFLRLAAMALATGVLAIPAIVLSAFDHGGRASSAVVAFWARTVTWLAGVPVIVEGSENMPPEGAQVYVSSHRSALDIPALLSVVPPRTRFLAKRELFRVPLFGWAIGMLGFVPIDREDSRSAVRALESAERLVRQHRPLLVFPEGTRSLDGRLLPFKKGAFALAHGLRLPVVPVACLHGDLRMPPKRLVVRPGPMVVRIGRVLQPEGPEYASRQSLLQAARAEIERLVAMD